MPFLAELAFFKQYGMPSQNHVPFNGDADAFQALAGNRAQLYATTAGTIKNFEVKPLVLLSNERDKAFPDCPTAKEEGKDLVISQWTCTAAASTEVPERDELYDRHTDPFQLHNIAHEHKDVAKQLLDQLKLFMAELRAS